MRRFLILATAFTATLAVAVLAGTNIINAIERQSYTATYSMRVGTMIRSWKVIGPTAALPGNAPIIIVLQGTAATTSEEIARDRLSPYVNADKAELVYPIPYRESWNAIGCCGPASLRNIDDLAFMKALVPRVNPGHRHPLYVVGYSNGGRLAYRVDCTYPGLFDATAIMKADPMPGCEVRKPQTILQVAALDDPWVPYKPGEPGKETPPATVQVQRLQSALRCTDKPTVASHGDMTLTTWSSCADGKRLGFAVYNIGGHNFPPPTPHSPSGSQIIWSFFTKTKLAPLPGQR